MGKRLRIIALLLVLAQVFSACAVFRKTERFAVTKLHPSTPEYYEFIALHYYQRGEYGRAIEYYKILLQRFAERAEAYDTELAWAAYEIGFCYYKQKRYAAAYRQFKTVITNYHDLGASTLAGQRLRALETLQPQLAESAF